MDSVSADQQQLPTRQAIEAQDRSFPGKVTGKLKRAMDAMIWDGMKRDDAAQSAGMSIHGLREALKRPHVKQYYKQQLEVLRESEHARNIHRLTEIRDAANNMPAVNAIKMLEQIADDQPGGGMGASHSPGITIRVIHQQPAPPMIDVTPNEDGA